MKNRTSGFTLVESMVVLLVVGLAVLLFTQIPLFSLSSWRKGTERLRMQRDAYYAMLRLQRKLRSASSDNIDVSDPSTLVIDLNTQESFFLQGNQLFYQDPDGVQELVIEGDAGTQFNATSSNGTINVILTLAREDVQTNLKTAVKPRN
ncbi:MAG: prepilin-type N-terminal cleavage/methylation domain-containing protein [bacterium]